MATRKEFHLLRQMDHLLSAKVNSSERMTAQKKGGTLVKKKSYENLSFWFNFSHHRYLIFHTLEEVWWLRWQGKILKEPGFKPRQRQEKYFLLFSASCFGTYEIHFISICHTAANTCDNNSHRNRIVHVSTREPPNAMIYLKVWLYICMYVLYSVLE